ncbi:SDR family NAD(P)-dependent oxidoreductase [Phaeocystidibacter luteus]|uniref:SDR family NAD(P)-dependent oxidoreductase n=1 Tax=Phaeocystidibacter luteus TaxID=911197 RepID=A0A6N6RH92_9FLAO|nr:SDR family NAD(P)-dependent oxidoreductase [Phaeocystidibacter luteus]KAB2808642.1 SDR family NAD(P)-dependent oxidoreductase [Phaeocystidibacter luteus]
MSTVVHITGTSSGLGKGLAEFFCAQSDTLVHGYSRRTSIEHPNYTHHKVDLTEVGSELSLELNPNAKREILINNAGWLGPVNPIGSLDSTSISSLFELNVSAVMRWTNQFSKNSKASNRVVVSISSGAAQYPIPSWSAYCASKAAVDMMTRVWAEEEKGIQFFSIAPGVVDTEMQADIRSKSAEEFPEIERFKSMHEAGELKSPNEVAEIIGKMALWPDRAPSNVFSVRDL